MEEECPLCKLRMFTDCKCEKNDYAAALNKALDETRMKLRADCAKMETERDEARAALSELRSLSCLSSSMQYMNQAVATLDRYYAALAKNECGCRSIDECTHEQWFPANSEDETPCATTHGHFQIDRATLADGEKR